MIGCQYNNCYLIMYTENNSVSIYHSREKVEESILSNIKKECTVKKDYSSEEFQNWKVDDRRKIKMVEMIESDSYLKFVPDINQERNFVNDSSPEFSKEEIEKEQESETKPVRKPRKKKD